MPQARHDGRHHQAWQVLAHQRAHREPDALPPLHETRRPVAFEQVVELVRDALGPAAAEGLVGERDGELLAPRVLHQACEALGPRALLVGLPGPGLAQQALRQLDRAVGPLAARAECEGAVHRSQSTPAALPFGRRRPGKALPIARAGRPCNSYLRRTSRRRHDPEPPARNVAPNKVRSLAPRMHLVRAR